MIQLFGVHQTFSYGLFVVDGRRCGLKRSGDDGLDDCAIGAAASTMSSCLKYGPLCPGPGEAIVVNRKKLVEDLQTLRRAEISGSTVLMRIAFSAYAEKMGIRPEEVE